MDKLNIRAGSLESYASIINIITKIKPHEIYHLKTQSYIDYAFKDEFQQLTQILTERISCFRQLKNFHQKTKFYFAALLKCLVKLEKFLKLKKTPFALRSVYGISKVAGYDLTRNYREAYNLFCCVEYYLTTSLQEEVLNSLLEKLRMLWLE